MSWAAYHASQSQKQITHTTVSALLPLFLDDSKSFAMIRHTFQLVKSAVEFLNPGQVPVVTFDQPLYALAKQIQWMWPDYFGEEHFLVMLGGLHTEMAVLRLLGDWLEGSGWVESLAKAEVAADGTANSFLKASHVVKTRRAHQITLCTLSILLWEAHSSSDGPENIDEWMNIRRKESPHFDFWLTVMELEKLVLLLVRSLREGDFDLYRAVLREVMPWFFTFDHIHYARWMTVHVRDMVNLTSSHPAIAMEFQRGSFVVAKSHRVFSSVSVDQAHKQYNAVVKGDGGIVGITQDYKALTRWMVCGPEIARVIQEFEAGLQHAQVEQNTEHHEQSSATQRKFAVKVKNLTDVIREFGNPFLEESNDLLKLDSRDVVDPAVAKGVQKAHEVGKEQYDSFVAERLMSGSKKLDDPIHKNKLFLFKTQPPRHASSKDKAISSLKSNCSLFSRLFISCQTRNGDLDNFFAHENHSHPPSLSGDGALYSGNKSSLLDCLLNHGPSCSTRPVADVVILDGAAIVHILVPTTCHTFADYSEKVFLPYIEAQLNVPQRLDIVWDRYDPNSLKSSTRTSRGTGTRRRVAENTIIPRNRQAFLRVDENKSELFGYLAEQAMKTNSQKQVITTKGENVMSLQDCNTSMLSPCNHEEADSRIFVHLADAVHAGLTKVLIRTVDTDVVVLAVSVVHQVDIEELWIWFGTGKNTRFIPAHEIPRSLGIERSKCLVVFHAFSGCDTVSHFKGIGKKTDWDVWSTYNPVTEAFTGILENKCLTDDSLATLERYTVLMYDQTSQLESVNETRKHLFTQKSRQIENLPPSQAALWQHILRAAYQGVFIWGPDTGSCDVCA